MSTSKTAKDFITEGLLMLMAKKDYAKITITDIAKRAGVNRVTFYRLFSSKDDIIEQYLTACDQNFDFTDSKYQNNNLYIILHYFQANKTIIDLLYRSHAEHLFLQHILKSWHYDRSDDNLSAYIKSAWAYFIFGWANEWYLRGMKETPEELIAISQKLSPKA